MLNGENSYECRLLRSADDVGLALHIWRRIARAGACSISMGSKATAMAVRDGTQLAQRGIQVFALDRRFGTKRGTRGDTPSLEQLLDDYLRGFRAAAALAGEEPLNDSAARHSGDRPKPRRSVLAGLIASGRLLSNASSSVPALAKCDQAAARQLRQLRVHTQRTWNWRRRARRRDYTDIPRYLDFMRNDPLMLRTITPVRV